MMHKYLLIKQVTKILVLLFRYPIGLHLARTDSYEKTPQKHESRVQFALFELNLFEFEVVDQTVH